MKFTESMELTENFSFGETFFSETAIRLGIDNTPPEVLLSNLRRMASFMEEVRYVLGRKPVRITSWYRSPELNAQIGGSKNSAHMKGLACDFVCPSLGDSELVIQVLAKGNLDFDQLILEGGRWVHVGLADGFVARQRREILTAFFPGPKYYLGILTEEPT